METTALKQIKKENKRLSHLNIDSQTDYDQLKEYLKTGLFPPGLSSAGKSRYRAKFAGFQIEGDQIVVYANFPPLSALNKEGKQVIDVDLPRRLVVLPHAEKDEILYELWKKPELSALRSAFSFYKKVSEEFLNVSREEVTNLVSRIQSKQMSARVVDVIVKPIVKTKVMEQWELDLVDMLNYRGPNAGVEYLLNIVDCHSKYLWSIPLKSKSGQLVARELEKTFFSEGAPKVISSDNGKEFVNDHMTALLLKWNVEQRNSQPYHPQSQGQIERLNGSLKESIYSYLSEYKTKIYVDVLPKLVYAYNTSEHASTKQKPFDVHRARPAKSILLSSLVADRLKVKADKMIDDSIKGKNGRQEPLRVGDTVRIASLALAKNRKLNLQKVRISRYTKEIYTVTSRKVKDGVEHFKVDKEFPGKENFYRHELLKVNLDADFKPSGQRDDSVEIKQFTQPAERALNQPYRHISEAFMYGDGIEEVKRRDPEVEEVAEEEVEAPGRSPNEVAEVEENESIPLSGFVDEQGNLVDEEHAVHM